MLADKSKMTLRLQNTLGNICPHVLSHIVFHLKLGYDCERTEYIALHTLTHTLKNNHDTKTVPNTNIHMRNIRIIASILKYIVYNMLGIQFERIVPRLKYRRHLTPTKTFYWKTLTYREEKLQYNLLELKFQLYSNK